MRSAVSDILPPPTFMDPAPVPPIAIPNRDGTGTPASFAAQDLEYATLDASPARRNGTARPLFYASREGGRADRVRDVMMGPRVSAPSVFDTLRRGKKA